MSEEAAGDADIIGEDLLDLYENAPCGYLSLRPDGRIFKSNRTFATWTGFSADELVGKRLLDLLNIAGRIFYETHFAPLLRMQGFFNEVALEVVRKDGTRLPVLVNAAERRGASGETLFIRMTVFNATDRRRYERDLVDAKVAATTRLSQSEAQLAMEHHVSELREQFIAVLGHDLRNPLAAIASGIRLLQRDPSKERAAQISGMMQQSIQRMAGLIDNVLDFTRGRLGGGIALRRETVDLEPKLRQVVNELQATHPNQPVECIFALPRPIDCDGHRIEQLLSNLLGNAYTHGAPGGAVTVRASGGGEMLEISVSNTGPMISAAVLERLFEPFERGNTTNLRQGLGLGLFISCEIAKAHGGGLTASSSPEETRFTFTMPLNHLN